MENTENDLFNDNKIIEKKLFFFNISIWKQQYIKNFFKTQDNEIIFVKKDLKNVFFENKEKNLYICWNVPSPYLESFFKSNNINYSILEDGFVRSKSLGSDLTEPLSLILDKRGIYFNPQQESDLEYNIKNIELTDVELDYGKKLLEVIKTKNISKYNFDNTNIPDYIFNKKNIKVVIGQVEDDASIKYGSNHIKTNLELLKEVYKNKEKEDYIIYKPHPDVTTGNRLGFVKEEEALKYCNIIDNVTPLPILINEKVEIHTISSLSGFENIIRGNKTVCYGNPFYSGWGLTEDLYIPEYLKARRNKKITSLELFTHAYIKYPIYYDNIKNKLTNPLRVIDIIQNTKTIKNTLILKLKRKIINYLKKLK